MAPANTWMMWPLKCPEWGQMWEKYSCSNKERTTLLSRINLENTTAKTKCGNKAVGKRSLIIVEQFGPNPQTKNNNFLFPLTMWAVNLALSFLAARSKLKDTKCFLSQYCKTKLCQLPVNYTIEDTGKGVELFWGELEITRSLRGMGVWLSRIRVARAKGRESGSGDCKVRIQHAGFFSGQQVPWQAMVTFS